ncbi:isocitrate/isopropylmalate family dehydrogenase [Salinifilum aidingensis]
MAGQDVANPIAMMLSSGMLLEWLAGRREDEDLHRAAALLDSGVARTVATGTCTPAMGGSTGTAAFAEAVANAIRTEVVV